jgi:hypothetical protein
MKEVLLGIGIGDIRFGHSREQCREILGEPDSTESLDYLEDGSIVDELWDYDAIEVTIHFSQDLDYKLTSIETESPNITLFGESIIGLSKPDALAVCKKLGLETPELEECEEGVERLIFDDFQLELWLEEGAVYMMEWGPFWLDEENPEWAT